MPHRLEITVKAELFDAEGEALRQKAQDYFGIQIERVRTVQILTIDAALSPEQLDTIRCDVFTNPVTQESSYDPLTIPFDWTIWIGYRPGVRDNPGSTAVEAIEDILGLNLKPGEAVYTSKRFCLEGETLTEADMQTLASELLANDFIQQWRVYARETWDPQTGIGYITPKVILDHQPTVTTIPVDSDITLQKISDERSLALNPLDIPVIRNYFQDGNVQTSRAAVGLTDPTDVELEYISQARSDHCNHNTFRGLFRYRENGSEQVDIVDSLFKTCIEAPTLELKAQKDWVVSVLWDNAGVARFDDNHLYVITGETHNSPSNMEAYGGAITGIVGIYRDPMGTGKGAKLIMGSYGFCVGPRDYEGDLQPRLHPRRLLDGVIEGVRDGGNKSGIPTTFGQILFENGYMGKCLVFVTALGLMPALVEGQPADQKNIDPGDLVIMSGGRVGKDGIHGVTASSEVFSENTPAGHVQIGDPYTQKKMHDFLLEARDLGLIKFITDNGGGGLSSSVGESARFSNGCAIELEKVPLKYEGLDQWEIWISESQERMTIAVSPEKLSQFMALSSQHAVESTVIGQYTDTGKLHITYNGETCAYVDLDLLTSGFPQWEFDAEWCTPANRGLMEPVISAPKEYGPLLLELLSDPNMASKEWVARQYDHEVQGTSVIKPLVGVERDVNSDASVIRPVLGSPKGLVFAQALLPQYSAIDAYHMTTCTIDEAVRRIVAVGGRLDEIGGVDNFCWPSIQYDSQKNPDGKFKAAQLVRSCQALRDLCRAYEIPLLSGKDSMYVDGHLPGKYGETHKLSALETLQFSTTSVVDDIDKCVTMDVKQPGDLVYLVGTTRNELGGSAYYGHFGYLGANVPEVYPNKFKPLYEALSQVIKAELVASVHGIFRGGLGIHLSMVAMGGCLGLNVNLKPVVREDAERDDIILFSESPGRFIVTISPSDQADFESHFNGQPCTCIGTVTEDRILRIRGIEDNELLALAVDALKKAWKKPFGSLI